MQTANANANGNKTSSKEEETKGVGPVCGGCNTEINPCCAMIKCTECINDDLDLNDSIGCFKDVIICIECFKNGKEFGRHKRFHRYNVLRPLPDFKLQSNVNQSDKFMTTASKNRIQKHNRWNGNDEWNLLHGIRRYGLGNWGGITKMINKQSFKKKSEQHFDYKHVESHFDYKYGRIVGKHQIIDPEHKDDTTNNKKSAASGSGSGSKASSVSMSHHTHTHTRRGGKKRGEES